jgi:hypothetical protein
MLRSFRVANHRSIRDEQELVLLPAYDKARPVVPVAAVFGANASGKSSLLDGLAWMRFAVRNSFRRWEAGSGVPRTRFRLDAKTDAQPSLFAVDLLLGGVQHAYGFTADSEQVIDEWLYSYPHRRKRVIFERVRETISFGSTVPDYKAAGELMSGLTRDNSLALSVAAQANQEAVTPVYDWFRESLRVSARAELDVARVQAAFEAQPHLSNLVRAADLGIREVQVLTAEPDPAMWKKFAEVSSELRDALHRTTNLDHARLPTLMRHRRELWQRLAGPPELVFRHGEEGVALSVTDQSDGTIAWIRLLVEAAEALRDGAVLLVDEIDASLHPHLTARLIALFQDEETNPKHAQLILTTHDASLLSPVLGDETLARDQVWFIEKGSEGASRLYPLTDFHPRQGESTARRYLGGSYGAVPQTSEYSFKQALAAGPAVNDAEA